MDLPSFRFHPDPIRSGSVEASTGSCRCCRKARGYVYTGPVYAEAELDHALCPWCIHDGAAHKKFDATFVDCEAFADGAPAASIDEISERTPGFATWQSEHWPVCCADATQFIEPVGIQEIRAQYRELEGLVLSHIIYNLGISGGAATRLLSALNKNAGPTAYLFRCPRCESYHVHVDHL